jgi:hypothetical protein
MRGRGVSCERKKRNEKREMVKREVQKKDAAGRISMAQIWSPPPEGALKGEGLGVFRSSTLIVV